MIFWLLACKGEEASDCVTDEVFFETEMQPVLEQRCIVCHNPSGLASGTRNILLTGRDDAFHVLENMQTLALLAAEQTPDGQPLLLAKPSGEVTHEGGVQLTLDEDEYAVFEEFVARSQQPGGCTHPGGGFTCNDGPQPGPTELRRLTDRQYRNAVSDLLGVLPTDGLFPVTEPGDHYSTWPSANLVSNAGVEGILLAAEDVVARLDWQTATGCSDDACAREWVTDFGRRAFRRPLTADETDGLLDVYELGTGPGDGVGLVIEVVLQSPQFLYITSLPSEELVSDDVVLLSDFAIAERLSFFLLDTVPDEALYAAAAAGELHTRAQVRDAAVEMLADPRSASVVAKFHQDWLRTYQLETIAKDETRYPEFGPELVADMRQELDLFTSEVVWLGDGSFDTLLYSNVTWTTPELDTLYGTSDARTGDGWERRELPANERPGVLSRTAFLTSHSYSATSSPVRRGTFVLEEFLCEEMTPPPGVDLELPEPTETNTIRDRLAAHRADPACASCHDRIDPVGYSFENYGALGEYRTDYDNGLPVDATGSLERPTGEFDGLAELLQTIDANDEENRARACYAQQWFSYAQGRAAEHHDRCSLSRLADRFDRSGGDIRELIVAVVTSDAFFYREVVE